MTDQTTEDMSARIYDEIDALCAKLADLGQVEEAWAIRRTIDRLHEEAA